MITQQDILDQQESMQEDLRSILDGIDESILDNACQVVVDRCNILKSKIDDEPDPDLEYTFACEECGTKAKWSMNNVVCAGTPICDECGDDMELV